MCRKQNCKMLTNENFCSHGWKLAHDRAIKIKFQELSTKIGLKMFNCRHIQFSNSAKFQDKLVTLVTEEHSAACFDIQVGITESQALKATVQKERLQDRSTEQNLPLLSQSKYVISPHFTNIIFSQFSLKKSNNLHRVTIKLQFCQ